MTDIEESANPLRVRKPPPGLDKDERRDFLELEAQRIADLQDQARTGGFRAVRPASPPRGLGRHGRRVWRETDRENRSQRFANETTSSESDRYVGALILMVIIAIVIAVKVLFSGSIVPQSTDPTLPAPTHTVQLLPNVRGE